MQNKAALQKNIFLLLGLVCLFFSILGMQAFVTIEKQAIEHDRMVTIAKEKHRQETLKKGTVKVKANPANLQKSTDQAMQIIIPTINVSTSVTESKIIDGFWQVSSSTASHGEGTADPGQKGNMVIFAHARVGLFAPLGSVKKGDTVYVLTKATWYRYTIVSTKTVIPSDISVVAPSTDERLTLYTCSGPFDQTRFVATAVRANPDQIRG